ncbi:hypothetical protein [Bremerella cremea]|uniref:hypothetical protein n=1 Tax=Bremerella cremea TaxID=1031537 RepID=UPI0031E8BA27
MLRQGKTSSLEVEVWYVPGDSPTGEPKYLEGPFIQGGKTLTSRLPFRPAMLGEQAAWKAIVPEPSLWTPQAPAVYQVNDTDQVIGLRELRARGESFYQNEFRWLIRAASSSSGEFVGWQTSDLVPIVRRPTPEMLQAASLSGQPLVVWMDGPADAMLAEASQAASVQMVVLPAESNPTGLVHSHLLIGAAISGESTLPDWAHFVVVPEELLVEGWTPGRRLPVVATRQWKTDGASPQQLRTDCDRFQAELSRGAEYAGLWLLAKENQ